MMSVETVSLGKLGGLPEGVAIDPLADGQTLQLPTGTHLINAEGVDGSPVVTTPAGFAIVPAGRLRAWKAPRPRRNICRGGALSCTCSNSDAKVAPC